MPRAPEDVIAQDCIATRIHLLDRAVTGIYEEELRAHGIPLTISQLTLLVTTARQGEASPKNTCEFLQMDPSTLSRNLQRMSKLIEASPDDHDARAKRYRLTPEGRRLLNEALPAWRKAQKRVEALLGKAGVELLCRLADGLCPGS